MSGEETAKSLPSSSKTHASIQGTSAANNAGAGPEYIRLRMITSDLTNEVHFCIKANLAMGRLKRSYYRKLGIQEELRFLFDGYRIADDDTPKGLNMTNEDIIEVYQERTGGM